MKKKKRRTAAWFALLLGWLGIHRFYLRQGGWGIVYIIMFFFGISFLLGLLDAVAFFNMSDETFDRRYNKKWYEKGYVHKNRYPSKQNLSRKAGQLRKASDQKRAFKDLLQEGKKLFSEFRVEEALEKFQKAYDKVPNNIAINYNLACSYSLLEKTEKAIEHLRFCLENGYDNFDKLKNQDALAFLRLQPEWFALLEKYEGVHKSLPEGEHQNVFDQLQYLAEMRAKKIISDEEYNVKKEELLKRKA